jgi:predicted nucleic acid-binding protein
VTLCVLDASVALAWAFKDEASWYATSVIRMLKDQRAIVPLIWSLEINNTFVTAVRRGRLQEAEAARLLELLDALPLEFDRRIAHRGFGQRIFSLSLALGLSSYDACYVELAARHAVPLATEDRRLAQAAATAGVAILQP